LKKESRHTSRHDGMKSIGSEWSERGLGLCHSTELCNLRLYPALGAPRSGAGSIDMQLNLSDQEKLNVANLREKAAHYRLLADSVGDDRFINTLTDMADEMDQEVFDLLHGGVGRQKRNPAVAGPVG
jgi:hypothetical protein